MVQILTVVAAALVATTALVSGAPMPTGTWPASKGLVKYDAPHVVKAGTVFDGGMKTYERSNVQCQGQKEGKKADAVFLLEPGATLKNVIIGKNQMEGVHCDKHNCVVENVWWEDVCEDALSVKGGDAKSVTKIIGGGARYADDKIIQHNSEGLVSIDGFYAQDFGKLYRSCGGCKGLTRHVTLNNVYAVGPTVSVITMNKKNGDTAKLKNVKVKFTKEKKPVCAFEGGEGPSGTVCQYTTKDVTI
uniref:Probable pectate lyase F n=1 Tax=Globisporangium ultimum (strain ATCC 200006 / CBS 805.95 / DAOM BR144) TaxID=431595 RepID=K3W7W2_GLOUD